MSGYTLHVVSHTHWDREWYLPFQVLRLRLVDLIDNLLDLLDRDPEFGYFHLDGQVIVLEDYLEIKPENKDRLREYIANGRILIGPWYQQNDQFLTSGEANVRNMMYGLRVCEEFGGRMMVGYCPDTFGNMSQLPQILRGFGIDNAVFGRGFNAGAHPKTEFIWESPDGSGVLAVVMCRWYNNAERIPINPEQAVELIEQLKEGMGPKAAVPHLLLMNGVDHLEPQYDLSEAMRGARELLKEDALVHSTLPEYIEAVKDALVSRGLVSGFPLVPRSNPETTGLERFRGELREDNHNSVLAGTLSTRMYLKQANHRSQVWLERYAEPASACAWMMGAQYHHHGLDYAWKLLMQNHTHDSICGCGDDRAHKEMEPRFRQVDQVAEDLTNRSVDYLARRIKTEGDTLVVFNTLAWDRTEKVTAAVDLPMGDITYGEPQIDPKREARGFRLTDADGKEIPFVVLDAWDSSTRTLIPSEMPLLQMVKRFAIEFVAEKIPALGYKTYRITAADNMPEFADQSLVHGEALDNGLVRVSFENGGLTVEDLREGGKTFHGLNVFEDGGEAGDEYTHAKPVREKVYTSVDAETTVTIIDRSPISATLRIEQLLMLPEAAEDKWSRRSEKLVGCPVTSYVTVSRGSARIDIRTEVENNAKDHRLRVVFPTGVNTNVSHAEGHYDVVTRPIALPEVWVNAATARPQQSWVDVNDVGLVSGFPLAGEWESGDWRSRGARSNPETTGHGLCLINRGLPEYELYDDEERTLALTLLRCPARFVAGNEALALLTEGAQCLGKHVFEYSVYPHAGDWLKAEAWRQAHQFNAPFQVRQTTAHEGDLPAEKGFIQIEPAELVVTAIKKAEREDKLIVRFYNASDAEVRGKVKVPGAKTCEVVDLNERPVEDLDVADGAAELGVAGKRIVTLAWGLDSKNSHS